MQQTTMQRYNAFRTTTAAYAVFGVEALLLLPLFAVVRVLFLSVSASFRYHYHSYKEIALNHRISNSSRF